MWELDVRWLAVLLVLVIGNWPAPAAADPVALAPMGGAGPTLAADPSLLPSLRLLALTPTGRGLLQVAASDPELRLVLDSGRLPPTTAAGYDRWANVVLVNPTWLEPADALAATLAHELTHCRQEGDDPPLPCVAREVEAYQVGLRVWRELWLWDQEPPAQEPAQEKWNFLAEVDVHAGGRGLRPFVVTLYTEKCARRLPGA